MSEIVAAFLAPQLDALGLITALRGAAYNYYAQGLRRLARKGWLTPAGHPQLCRSNYHIFHIMLESKRPATGYWNSCVAAACRRPPTSSRSIRLRWASPIAGPPERCP